MKDFNKIQISQRTYSKSELEECLLNQQNWAPWEEDFWKFISQWINDKSSIEVRSSGSTGEAKLIVLEKSKMLKSAAMTCKYFNLDDTKTALLCLSTKHIGGMMMVVRAFYSGMNLMLQAPSSNPFKNLEHSLDFAALVPYQCYASIAASLHEVKACKHILIGGGKINKDLESLIKVNEINAYSSFGMTETISHFAIRDIRHHDYYECLPGLSIEVNQENQLIIKANELIDEDLITNDLVELKGENRFIHLGRKDFAIESGGLKILPEQVEAKLEAHIPYRFMISSRPSALLNNELILLIEAEVYNLDTEVFSRLDKYERPKDILFIKAFAEVNNKIDRKKTRALALSQNH